MGDFRPYLQPLGRSIDLSLGNEWIEEIRADDDIEAQDLLILILCLGIVID